MKLKKFRKKYLFLKRFDELLEYYNDLLVNNFNRDIATEWYEWLIKIQERRHFPGISIKTKMIINFSTWNYFALNTNKFEISGSIDLGTKILDW